MGVIRNTPLTDVEIAEHLEVPITLVQTIRVEALKNTEKKN